MVAIADRSPARYIFELNWRKCRAARLHRGMVQLFDNDLGRQAGVTRQRASLPSSSAPVQALRVGRGRGQQRSQ